MQILLKKLGRNTQLLPKTPHCYLGEIYRRVKVDAPNYREAAKWFLGAAKQGCAEAGLKSIFGELHDTAKQCQGWDAQYYLGVMHHRGKDAPLDSGIAEKLFREAARNGHTVAQYSLGSMLANAIMKNFIQGAKLSAAEA